MKSILIGRTGNKIENLPEPYCRMQKVTMEKENLSIYNQGQRVGSLNPVVVKAAYAYFAGTPAEIALVKVSDQMYAVEANLPEGTLIASMNANGRMRAAIREKDGTFVAVPNLEQNKEIDTAAFVLGFLPILRRKFGEVHEILNEMEQSSNLGEPFGERELYKLSDSVFRIFIEKRLETDVKNGSIEFLDEQTLTMGGLRYNQVICGSPSLLTAEGADGKKDHNLTVAEAKALFAEFSAQFVWDEKEEDLIPVFEDDFAVPEETLRMARRYVMSADERRPMVNFMWRGVTAYGKSTGVEILACILHMPLLRVTCSSNMETQDFLSDFVPNTESNANGDVPRFKHIESNYVRALEKGYIVEVQEISRIKDSGVLVGLNEYDRAGAIIPLVDGSYTRRHKRALVVYTDNVGYNSCRPIDPSVIRRMAFIIDSYDLPKEKAMARLKLNTGVEDTVILEKCYKVWDQIRDYCRTKAITEGSVSMSELEMWVMAVKMDGYRNYRENCIECVVAKATNDIEEQEGIISAVVDLYL